MGCGAGATGGGYGWGDLLGDILGALFNGPSAIDVWNEYMKNDDIIDIIRKAMRGK